MGTVVEERKITVFVVNHTCR